MGVPVAAKALRTLLNRQRALRTGYDARSRVMRSVPLRGSGWVWAFWWMGSPGLLEQSPRKTRYRELVVVAQCVELNPEHQRVGAVREG
jgi:hypothetical protein